MALFWAAHRRRLSRHEKGPDVSKLFRLSCGVLLTGAGDDAVVNEARTLIDRQVEELQAELQHQHCLRLWRSPPQLSTTWWLGIREQLKSRSVLC